MKKQSPIPGLLKSVGAILGLVLLIKAFTGSGDLPSASTPDPSLMTISERTIWELEEFRNELHGLAAAAADTPVEDLEPVIRQMDALIQDPQKNPEVPPFAARAHSALLNYAFYTKQCYFDKYAAYLGATSMGGARDACDQARSFEETFDLYLVELKELDADS